MASSTVTRPRVNRQARQPLTASLALIIRDDVYGLTSISPGEDGSRAWRLEKRGDADAIYDAIHLHSGEMQCSCPDWEARSPDQCGYRCKHLTALCLVGLHEAPATEPIGSVPARVADEFDEPARVAYDNAREAAATIAEAPAPSPDPAVPAFDREPYRAQNAVAEGRALWLCHRHLHTSEPLPAPCCPDADPLPCEACTTHDGPGDLSDDEWHDDERWTVTDDDGWQDGYRWELTPDDEPAPEPTRMDFADWVQSKADEHARIGGERHAWLGRKIAELARQAGFLGATDPDDFDDRHAAALVADEDHDGDMDQGAWIDHAEYAW